MDPLRQCLIRSTLGHRPSLPAPAATPNQPHPLLRLRYHHGRQEKSLAALLSGGQLGARLLTVLPGRLENLSGKKAGGSRPKPLCRTCGLHLCATGLLALCVRGDSGSCGLRTIHTVSPIHLAASGDQEKFSKIPFLGKPEAAKCCLSGIEKCSYVKAKLCCNGGTRGPSCKTCSHFNPQSWGPLDARMVS